MISVLTHQVFPYCLGILIFFFSLFIPTLLALPFPQTIRNKMIHPFWPIFARLLLKFVTRSQVTLKDRRRFPSQNYGLYICNHQSFMDIPVYALSHRAPPLMKKEVVYLPLFGIVALASGSITVSRKDPSSRKKALTQCIHRLKNGIPVQYYPEGTRSRSGRPKTFEEIHKTLLCEAYKLQQPVTPISIYGTEKILTKKGQFIPHQKVGIITHAEIFPKDFTNENDFARACWDKVLEGYAELDSLIGEKRNLEKPFLSEIHSPL